jgi:hypothetical protein
MLSGMKNPTGKEQRLHSDPDSCAVRREAYGEAEKEASAGREIEPRKLANRVLTLFA